MYEPSQSIKFGTILFQSNLIRLCFKEIDPAHLQFIKFLCITGSTIMSVIITLNYISNSELI